MSFTTTTCDHCGRNMQAVVTRRPSRPAERDLAPSGELSEGTARQPRPVDATPRSATQTTSLMAGVFTGSLTGAPHAEPSAVEDTTAAPPRTLRGPARPFAGPRVSPLRFTPPARPPESAA